MTYVDMLPSEAAALLMAKLEHHGATFAINDEGYLRANLDNVPYDVFNCPRDVVVAMVLSLAHEIKQLIRSNATEH